MTSETDRRQVEKLVDGELGWEELRNDVLPDPKDPERFEATREILQERVDWENPILVPLNDHLYVVGSEAGSDASEADDGDPADDGRSAGRLVKCDCGHEFCGADENWKEHARVRVREEEAEHREIYPQYQTPHPEWTFQLREWFCPGCLAQLDVDAVPAGYPVLRNFEPDVDAFYEEWLGETPPDGR